MVHAATAIRTHCYDPAMTSASIEARERVREVFLAHGLSRVRFTDAAPVEDRVSPWVAAGRQASMEWLAREPARRTDTATVFPGARTVICTAVAYPATDARGPIAGYARGEDYHHTLRDALERGLSAARELTPGMTGRVCVDTAPLLERAFAARAGLGWIGRNTMLLDETLGPWMLLGEVLVDVAFPPDAPVAERCGTCTACVDACPTEALDEQGLDARRCLSYWTIEHRGPLPDTWAQALGQRVFGCDDCLTACPFPGPGAAAARSVDPPRGRLAGPLPQGPPPGEQPAEPPAFSPRDDLTAPDLDELERLANESFRRHFGSTPLERARKGGFLRNIAAVRAAARDRRDGH